jgi:hypothetical protein
MPPRRSRQPGCLPAEDSSIGPRARGGQPGCGRAGRCGQRPLLFALALCLFLVVGVPILVLIVALGGQSVAGARELARQPERITDRGPATTATADRAALAAPRRAAADQPVLAQAYAAADRQLRQLRLISTPPLGTVPLLGAQAPGRATLPRGQEPPGVPGQDGTLIVPQWGDGWGPNLRQRPRDRGQGGAAERDSAPGDPAAGTRYAHATATGLADAAGPTRTAQAGPLRIPQDPQRRLQQIERELAELRTQRKEELGGKEVTPDWVRRAIEYARREEALLTESKEIEIFQQLHGLPPQELRRWGKEIQYRLDQIEETVQRDELGLSRPGAPPDPEVSLAPQRNALQNAYEYIQRQVPVPPELRLPREELLSHAASVKARLDAIRAQQQAELGGKDVTPELLDRYWELRRATRDLEREYAETQAVLRATTPPEAPEAIIDPWASPARQKDGSLEPSGTPVQTAAGEDEPTTAPGTPDPDEQADASADGGPAAPGDTWVIDASSPQEDSSPQDGASPADSSPFDNGITTT